MILCFHEIILLDLKKFEELQHAISSEAANVSVLSSGKIDKYEHLTDETI